ncbi:unnamed protein product [Tilletia laevis]|nr:hypothetical protein CF335_g4163 [Tilletia laevis]KAE8249542.1 hypothetical protein A4X03_0g6593 [Tilletia caries]CAD6979560.1 unnamed protein product [Tilletia controversa]KAE8200596.1 hypothetical protein CF336_g618 [Tilletia laevis]CAD6888131.1 unnamed protein product [Tilletia caries]
MSSSAASERLVVPALCQPSLLADLPSHDTIFHLLAKHIPPHLRPARDTTGTFPPDESPTNPDLALAMRTNAWRRIALYARERIISAGAPAPSSQPVHDLEPAGPNDVSTVLRWWTVRLQALLRLRLYSQFQLELESLWAILKRTTIPRHSSSSSSSTATTTVRWARLLDSPIVPFSLHVLRAREPLLSADPRAALEKCHALLQRCKVMQRRFVRVAKVDGLLQEGTGTSELEAGARAEAGLWEERGRRMTVLIAFILLDLEDYPAAINLLRPLISPSPSSSPTAQAYNLLFARLFLEAGAVASAQACIQSVSASLPTPIASSDIRTDSGSAETQLQQLLDVSKALLAVWQGDYPAAVGQWERVVHGPQSQSGNHMDMDNSREINPAAMSNLALSRFYQGNVDEATTLLERLLQDEPSTATSAEAVIFNLITMHELRSDDSISHKRRILVHVAQWAGDGTGTSCLKLI